jgi:hypothetical protein
MQLRATYRDNPSTWEVEALTNQSDKNAKLKALLLHRRPERF